MKMQCCLPKTDTRPEKNGGENMKNFRASLSIAVMIFIVMSIGYLYPSLDKIASDIILITVAVITAVTAGSNLYRAVIIATRPRKTRSKEIKKI